jgi:hypothetical protein
MCVLHLAKSGLGSSVGIATGYGLDGPGIESQWAQNFPHLSRPAVGPTQPPVQWVAGLSRVKEQPGRDADPSPTSSAVGHERVELYLYFSYGPYGLYRVSVLVQGWPLPFYFCLAKDSISGVFAAMHCRLKQVWMWETEVNIQCGVFPTVST